MDPESYGSCTGEYFLSAALAVLYVGSIYIWKQTELRSTHPSVIKKRLTSVSGATLLSVLCVHYFVDASLTKDFSVWALLGFRIDGIINAIILPLFLTIILFSGSIAIDFINSDGIMFEDRSEILVTMTDILWIRNYVFAPITEEIVFRGCMLVLIINCTEPLRAILLCPIFFGTAHIHHMLEQIRFRVPWKNAFLISMFQFLYTTIFGAYSAYLFLRTGHIIAPIVVHAFCNLMGFPNFSSVFYMTRRNQVISVSVLVTGLILWVYLLDTLTNPPLFNNTMPWTDRI